MDGSLRTSSTKRATVGVLIYIRATVSIILHKEIEAWTMKSKITIIYVDT